MACYRFWPTALLARVPHRSQRRLMFTLAGVAVALSITNAARAGKKVYVGRQQVAAANQRALADVNHAPWNRLLQKYVDTDGLVAYRTWKANKSDLRALRSYLEELSAATPSAPNARNAQLAYWINAYNAVTVWGMLREYPTKSIRDHTARLYGYNIWHDLLLHVDGKTYSLDQIEHQILRKMDEPRIHFAVVCASKGCPRLLNEAYTAEHVNEQLTRNAQDFFRRGQNFRHDVRAKRFYLSAILKWYAEDFGDSQQDQLRSFRPWLPTPAARAAATAAPSVRYLDYDWSINEQPYSSRKGTNSP